MFRSHCCTELSIENIKNEVILAGWVNRRRDHGDLIFVDLRDRSGLIQIVFDPEVSADSHSIAETLRSEFVIKVEGIVRPRGLGLENPNMVTGKIEIIAMKVEILNESKNLPFSVNLPIEATSNEVSEDVRLKYRYLDLRREKMRDNMEMRYKVIKTIRDYLDEKKLWEIETPMLIKGTPEGAREYLVPSRVYPGNFYVLPQSPQQMKQLLMVSGMDKYFQIARCFRDEDQRGDRQPEFTQLDMEMSFIEQEDIMQIIEELLILVTEKHLPKVKIKTKPFPVLTYDDAMLKYGSDKPDLRFDLEIKDVTSIVKNSEFKVFADAEVIRALKIPDGMRFSRKEIDEATEVAKIYKAKGLAYIVVDEEIRSPILKYLTKGEGPLLVKTMEAKKGDLIFFVADKKNIAAESMGAVRVHMANKLNLVDNNIFAFAWVVDFPLFEAGEEEGSISATHHPFTRPKTEDLNKFDSKDLLDIKAVAYDVVLNGYEIGGGSIRIHERDLQAKIFKALNISDEDSARRFGHILEAFTYGAPPHGGIALGRDQLIMLITGEKNIREVMAFPKDGKARDLMLGAPSEMPKEQIKEANIEILAKKKD